MRRQFIWMIGLIALIGCSNPTHRRDRNPEPIIRVGLLENRDEIYFMVGGPFSIFRADGRFVAKSARGTKWKARIVRSDSAVFEYRLRYWMTADHKLAFEKSHELAEKHLRPQILEMPSPVNRWRIKPLERVIYHVVLWETFPTRQAAEARKRELAARVGLEIMEMVKKPAGGIIEIASTEFPLSYRFPSGSLIITDRFALLDVPVGEGFHWADTLNLVYRGKLQFLINRNNKLTAVNVLPIETYLRGVVPAEMNPGFPLEALKAQAVAARSQVLEKIARNQAHEDFDICATVHCQVYRGLVRESESSNQAVRETSGMVLFFGDKILDAVYSGVCGGHTENNESMWAGNPQPALRGIFDGKGRPDLLDGMLRSEERVRRWIDSKPPVYCNTLDDDIPTALDYTKKYFRWQETLKREELEASIRKATGQLFGQLQDLQVVERGVSGRATRLRVIGTGATFDIDRELTIRRALKEKTLYSTCFVIEKHNGTNGLPASFTFRGAGWGHGVGMCQTGAAGMALQGMTFDQILKHYYQGVKIGAVY
ncbi:MAG: SpoIID/LytB domain-containing protein [candidate division KSB1 bacterium]|nr:SpoIID/LytB domain-containing protein [candidate division KSB1 bacterium]MDQ7064840.1 SpoIID/LytB domain-containing protein [candidate division KSB1 bacterium]